jgi:solute carrier family 25 carnitine/acylcarnitine transporter 20/29
MYKGYMDCASKMLRLEGLSGFYRGIAAPMLGGGAENAVAFAAFASGLALFSTVTGTNDSSATSIAGILFAGALSGVAVAHVLTPVEMLKCNMQIQNVLPPEKRLYSGVLDCAAKMIRAGGVRSLFAGHTATLARETPGNAAWFGSYHKCKQLLCGPGESIDSLPVPKLMLAGGVGGVLYWTAFFPADVVKTKMQTNPEFCKLGLLRGLGRLYKDQGVRGLYTGWSITAIRAFPANAIIFSVYETFAHQWDRFFPKHFPL